MRYAVPTICGNGVCTCKELLISSGRSKSKVNKPKTRMETTVDAGTLCKNLPSGSSETLLTGAPDAVGISDENPYFVEPALSIEGEVTPWKSPITIISAAGAVGKTALAHYISEKTESYLCDIGQLKLGVGSFTGLINKSFGRERLNPIIEKMIAGDELLVVDAFDEAELKEGFDRIEDFVYDCWHEVGNANSTSLIFLARSRTASELKTAIEVASLSDEGPSRDNPCSIVSIDYFGYERSKKLIKSEISLMAEDDKSIMRRYENYKGPFWDAVDAIFRSTAKSFKVDSNIWDDEKVKSFLGYAPVLQTIARYLADPKDSNYFNVKESVRSEVVGEEEIDITNNLIDKILRREGKKVRSRISEKVGVPINDIKLNKIYQPKEQLERILLYMGEDGDTSIPADTKELIDVPSELKNVYYSNIKGFISQHPFIKEKGEFTSPAFRDYLYANSLKWGKLNLQEIARNTVLRSKYTPTPLLIWFYEEEGRNMINDKDVGILYESYSARDSAFQEESHLDLYPRGSGRDETHTAVFRRINKKLEYDVKEVDKYVVRTAGSEVKIFFPRRVENTTANVDGQVILGGGSPKITIVDSEIRSESIDLKSQHVYAKSNSEGQLTLITTKDFHLTPPYVKEVEDFGDGEFVVQWPGSNQHPWEEYHDDIEKVNEASRQQSFIALRSILKHFKKHKRPNLGVHSDFIDNSVVGNVKIKNEMLKYLKSENIIYCDGEYYKIDIQELQCNNLSWNPIFEGKINDDISNFVDDFVKQFN